MATITQTDTDSRTVRVRGDVWQAARAEAERTRRTLTETLDYALRKQFKMAPRIAEQQEQN